MNLFNDKADRARQYESGNETKRGTTHRECVSRGNDREGESPVKERDEERETIRVREVERERDRWKRDGAGVRGTE